MQNLNRILNRDNKWYRIGPIQFPRGLHKRTPIYFLFLEAICFLTSYIPIISPTWWIETIIPNGWGFNYIIIPIAITFYLQSFRKAGKTSEKYLWTLLQYKMTGKHHSAFGAIRSMETFRFHASGFTIALHPRKRIESIREEERSILKASVIPSPYIHTASEESIRQFIEITKDRSGSS